MAAELVVRLDLTMEDAETVRLLLRWIQEAGPKLSDREAVVLTWLIEQLSMALAKAAEAAH